MMKMINNNQYSNEFIKLSYHIVEVSLVYGLSKGTVPIKSYEYKLIQKILERKFYELNI